jgi:hypothetical protein
MFEPISAEIDAAGDGNVVVPATRLVSFVCDAVRYAEGLGDADARRLALSPYSGLAHADACALIVAAGPRATFLETVGRERVPLDRERLAGTHAFARALAELERVYRTQGVTLEEVLDAVRLHFAFAEPGSPRERTTFEALFAAARTFDEQAGPAWHVAAALRALERVAPAPLACASAALVALPAREPEERRSVRRRKTHYSASSLAAYAECERRWYYRYVCASVEDKGSSASFYGSAFHWALERFHEALSTRRRRSARRPRKRNWTRWLQTAFERYRSGFETNGRIRTAARRARRTGRRYLAWFVERGATHPFSVIGTETEASNSNSTATTSSATSTGSIATMRPAA